MSKTTKNNLVKNRSTLWKKLRRWLKDYKWPLIGAVGIAALVLGYLGFRDYFLAIGERPSFLDNLYRSLQLFLVNTSGIYTSADLKLQLARLLAFAVTAYAGMETLAFVFREQFQMLRLRFFKDHIVICGLGRKGLLLAESFVERGEQVVVIETDEGNDLLRRCREQGIIVLVGNATVPGVLLRAKVDKAKYLISVCGNDGANAKVAVCARELVAHRKGKALSCLVHIVDLQLCNLLREQQIRMGRPDVFRLEFFNVFESGARVLLNKYPPFPKTGEAHGTRPHIIVVGIGRMGESVVVNAARSWRNSDNAVGERLRITIIDRDARKKKDSLYLRYPQMEKVCELVAGQMDIQSAEFEQANFALDHDGHCGVTAIYVCLDDDSNSMAAALVLHQRLRAFATSTPEIPIVVRMTQDTGLATLLEEDKDNLRSFSKLYAFGLLDNTCTLDLIFGCTYEILARAFHDEYVRNEMKKGNTSETKPSVVSWEQLSEDFKESSRNEVEHIRDKLEAIGCDVVITTDWDVPVFQFSPEELELMSQMEHDRFVKERLNAGWKYGLVRDLVKKTNPTLVPWNKLSDEEKDIDRNLVRGIPESFARIGFQICRFKKGM